MVNCLVKCRTQTLIKWISPERTASHVKRDYIGGVQILDWPVWHEQCILYRLKIQMVGGHHNLVTLEALVIHQKIFLNLRCCCLVKCCFSQLVKKLPSHDHVIFPPFTSVLLSTFDMRLVYWQRSIFIYSKSQSFSDEILFFYLFSICFWVGYATPVWTLQLVRTLISLRRYHSSYLDRLCVTYL